MRTFVFALFYSLAAATAAAQEMKDLNPMITYMGVVVPTPSREFFEKLEAECRRQRNLTWTLECVMLVQKVEEIGRRMLDVPDVYPEFMAATKKLLEKYPKVRIAVEPYL